MIPSSHECLKVFDAEKDEDADHASKLKEAGIEIVPHLEALAEIGTRGLDSDFGHWFLFL